jgi:hypothetical protein
MAIVRITALPAAIAVMAATVALSPGNDRATAGEPAMNARAFVADFSQPGATPAAVSNLKALLADHATATSAKLTFSLFDSAPTADLQHTLMHKSDGSFYLALWRAHGDTARQVAPVTVSFGQPVQEAEEFKPSVSTAAQTTWAAPGSVTVPVGDALVVLKILPSDALPSTTAAATLATPVEAAPADTTPTTGPASALTPNSAQQTAPIVGDGTQNVPAASDLRNISQVFAGSSFWYQPVSGNVPLAANSSAVVANAVQQMHQYYGTADRTNVTINTTEYAAPVYVAGANDPVVNVGFNDCQGKGSFDPNLKSQWTSVPIPSYAQPADGTDQEMVIYSPSQDRLWEFWVTKHDGNNWSACWGGRLDNVSTSSGIFPGNYGTTATGLPFMGGQISIADLKSGTINHAIGIAFVETRANTVSWPAQRSDGWVNDPNAPAEGQRFRLDPTLDIDTLNLNPVAKMVAKAAQKYGLVVWDKSGAVGLRAENPKSLTTQGKNDPYPAMFGNNTNWNVLDSIPWNRLQALPYNYAPGARDGTEPPQF